MAKDETRGPRNIKEKKDETRGPGILKIRKTTQRGPGILKRRKYIRFVVVLTYYIDILGLTAFQTTVNMD
jgi:hypothetical protein